MMTEADGTVRNALEAILAEKIGTGERAINHIAVSELQALERKLAEQHERVRDILRAIRALEEDDE